MFQLVELADVVRVPPDRFGTPLEKVALELLKLKYESTINPDHGYLVLVTKVDVDKVGKIIAGDGATYHRVNFEVLAFYPLKQEIVEGEIVEVTDFGAFVRIGPADALLHLSQIMDDYLTSDVKSGIITASQSKRTLRVGSKVRVRITAVSLGHGISMGKIGVTCRQPYLGAIEWIEDEITKAVKSKKAEDRGK
ncbi:MAG: DNA-directed RNA polymerase [Nitrososphaerota archaeon]|nr:DNA-directed RNA polymerase [Nitrososphaerota archaeon]